MGCLWFKQFVMAARILQLSCILKKHFHYRQFSFIQRTCMRSFSSSNNEEEENPDEFRLEYLGDKHKGIALFVMDRPAVMNAFGKNFMRLFREALDTVKFDKSVRILVIKSNVPGIFCAGADLKERKMMSGYEVGSFAFMTRKTAFELSNLPMPTIAAIDGHALGGGLEIALACDFRIAASNAKLGLVETGLAIIPGTGGTQRLPRLIRPSKAKELIFAAKVITGPEAVDIGLANYSVDQNDDNDAAYRKALELAEEILPNGPVAVRMAKQSVNRGVEVDLATAMAIEEMCYAQTIPTNDRLEGLKAFAEKRLPVYKGE